MKTLFEIQTESGQLWPDIAAQIEAKDAENRTAMTNAQNSNTQALADKDAEHSKALAARDMDTAAKAEELKSLTDARDAVIAEFAAYKEAAGRGATAIRAVISDPTKDDATTVAAITQIVTIGETEANKTQRERELEAAIAERDAAEAKVKELSA